MFIYLKVVNIIPVENSEVFLEILLYGKSIIRDCKTANFVQNCYTKLRPALDYCVDSFKIGIKQKAMPSIIATILQP